MNIWNTIKTLVPIVYAMLALVFEYLYAKGYY